MTRCVAVITVGFFILLQNYIYFGSNQSRVIHIYKKSSLSRISSFRMNGTGGITDMTMFASDVQPSTTSKSVGVKTYFNPFSLVVHY